MSYNGTVELAAGIKPKNNGSFPLVNAPDVRITDSKRLDAKLTEMDAAISSAATAAADGTKAQAMIAAEEASSTAAAAHEVGDYFRLGGILYITTAAIAIGDTITPGTNCAVAVLGDDVSALKSAFANAASSDISATKDNLSLQNNTVIDNLFFKKGDEIHVSVSNNTQSTISVTLSDNQHSITLFASVNAGATQETPFVLPYDMANAQLVCYVNNNSGSITAIVKLVSMHQVDIAPMFRKNRFQIVEINANTYIPLHINGEIAPRLSKVPSPASPATLEKTSNVYVGHWKTGETTQYDHLIIANGGVYLGEYDTEAEKAYDTGRLVTFDGSEVDWRQLSGTNTFYIGMGLVKTHPTETTYGLLDYDFACTHYPNKPYDGAKFVSNDASINQCCGMGLPQFGYSVFVVNDTRFSTLEEWKSYLATTTLQIVYRSTKSNPDEYNFLSLPAIYARWETEKIDACYTSSNRPLFTVEGALPVEILKVQDNPLYGKLALFMGDSICYGGENTKGDDVGRAWAGRIADTNNMNYFNYGISGLKIAKTLTNVPYIAGWIDTLHTDHPTCDYLILEGGTNDADTLTDDKIGTLDNNDFSGTYDDTTFYGALDTLFYKAVTYYPNAKIGYIVAQKMGTTANVSARRYQFFEYAMNACKKWGIPFINLWEDGQLNPNLTVYYDPSLTEAQNISQGKAYRDGQHLTPAGYDIISPKIAEWMKTL